jgi:PhzF family phenazine biosynthesis protein
MPTTIQYNLVDAFNIKPFSGNAAAVVILDQATQEKFERKNLYPAISMELNQPATAFATLKADSSYDIRWFDGVGGELNLCGHATLAASKILFGLFNTGNKYQEVVRKIDYNSGVGPLQARLLDDGRIELGFPAAGLASLTDSCSPEEVEDIRSILKAALQDDTVNIMEIQRGVGKAFDHWLIVKVDSPKTAIKDLSVKHDKIVSYFPLLIHYGKSF